MVALFTDIPREETKLAWPHYRSKIKRVTEAKSGFDDFFFFIIFYILFLCNTIRQVDNFIFDCVREKLFLCGPYILYSRLPIP